MRLFLLPQWRHTQSFIQSFNVCPFCKQLQQSNFPLLLLDFRNLETDRARVKLIHPACVMALCAKIICYGILLAALKQYIWRENHSISWQDLDFFHRLVHQKIFYDRDGANYPTFDTISVQSIPPIQPFVYKINTGPFVITSFLKIKAVKWWWLKFSLIAPI